MKSFIILASIFASIVIFSCNQEAPKTAAQPENLDSLKLRGEYLVTIMGCGDCHSPKIMTPNGPAPDTSLLFSGHRANTQLPPIDKAILKSGWALFGMENTVLVTPMGASFAANITSDVTGIGDWTFDQFKLAMTKGKWKGLENSRTLLPPMPWPNYAKLTETDLKAIYTYLKATKPIKNIVPQPIPADKL